MKTAIILIICVLSIVLLVQAWFQAREDAKNRIQEILDDLEDATGSHTAIAEIDEIIRLCNWYGILPVEVSGYDDFRSFEKIGAAALLRSLHRVQIGKRSLEATLRAATGPEREEWERHLLQVNADMEQLEADYKIMETRIGARHVDPAY